MVPGTPSLAHNQPPEPHHRRAVPAELARPEKAGGKIPRRPGIHGPAVPRSSFLQATSRVAVCRSSQMPLPVTSVSQGLVPEPAVLESLGTDQGHTCGPRRLWGHLGSSRLSYSRQLWALEAHPGPSF